MMKTFEPNFKISIRPNFPSFSPDLDKFRWNTHVALPYPFPSRNAPRESASILDKQFSISIGNFARRVIKQVRNKESEAPYFCVGLEDARNKRPDTANGTTSSEILQSVVLFDEQTEYSSPNDAFSGTPEKLKACFEWLGEFLTAFHRSAPYMMSWAVYPISMFDVGVVYHGVTAHSVSQNA